MASTYSIFDFLRNCSGNWRNTLYVPCGFCSHPCRAKQRGVLVTADGYGRPQAISVVRYEAITGLFGSSRFGNASMWEIAFSAAWTAK